MSAQKGNQSAVKHGVYAVQSNGPQTPSQRSRHAELVETLSEREGLRQALLDHVATCVILREMALNYVAKSIQSGVPMDSVTMLDRLAAFLNSERLGLLALEKITKNAGRHSADIVLKSLKGNDNEQQ